jgi:hypothetical protein
MSQIEEKTTRGLADLKAYLERRLAEYESEAQTLRGLIEIVDGLLTEKSYRRLQIPKTASATPSSRTESSSEFTPSSGLPASQQSNVGREGQSIRTISGVELASITVQGRDLRVMPSPEMRFDPNSPPMKSFLISKVLEPLHRKDEEDTRKTGLSPDNVLEYTVSQEGNRLKELYVKNYGDERRLNELKNALRWTFRRMYEKTIGTQQ